MESTRRNWSIVGLLCLGLVVAYIGLAVGILSPALTGWLIQTTGSYDAPMRAILFVLLLGIVSYVFVVRRRFAPRVVESF